MCWPCVIKYGALEIKKMLRGLMLMYKIWCTRNKKCFAGIDVDVVATIQKAQRSILILIASGQCCWRL